MSKARLMQGNEACAEGAIAAGVNFFAGYPITPSTEIAETMARLLPKHGGKFVQMEDEIASMGAILGAACALPYVGKPIAAACFIFALGYSIQNAFLGLTNRNGGAPTPQTGNPASAAAAPDAPQNGSGNPPQAPTA